MLFASADTSRTGEISMQEYLAWVTEPDCVDDYLQCARRVFQPMLAAISDEAQQRVERMVIKLLMK